MNVGAIGYEVHSGLGHLMRSFYQAGVVNRVLIIRHPHYQNYSSWYPADRRFPREKYKAFLQGLDVLILFENAFVWDIPKRARVQGTKVVMIPNYEYTPFPIPVKPDLVLCGSLLDVDYYKSLYNTKFLTMPVEVDRFPWRLREKAHTFIHNAGHGQRGFAKGTPQLVEAMQYVQSPIKLIVRGQPGEKRIRELFDAEKGNPRVEFQFGEFDDDHLYPAECDVFINAEQYNGMSLPLQEAYASGMLVMTTDRYPTNTWLPCEPLLPVNHYVCDSQAVEFDRAIVDPRAIAESIDAWYGRDITQFSIQGYQWAQAHSWEALKLVYQETLECLA